MPSAAPPPMKQKPRSPGKGAPLHAVLETSDEPDVDDPLVGEWLFKQGDMVLGPVSAKLLMERIDKGEISPDTPVGREAGKWRPLTSIGAFKDAHDARQLRIQREAEEKAWQARIRKARLLRFSTLAVLVLGPFAGGAFAGRQVMITRPWDTTEEWMQRVPPLVDLPKKEEAPAPPPPVAAAPPAAAAPSGEAPAADAPPDEGQGEKVASAKDARASSKKERDRKDDKKKGDDGKKVASAAAPEPPPPKEEKQSGPLPETLTNEQAVAPLKTISGDLKACFVAELSSNPDVPAQVTLSYTVTENGTATNVRFEERELRGRPVVDCTKKAMSNARWPRFTGERKNVSVPFKLGKPKAAGAK